MYVETATREGDMPQGEGEREGGREEKKKREKEGGKREGGEGGRKRDGEGVGESVDNKD